MIPDAHIINIIQSNYMTEFVDGKAIFRPAVQFLMLNFNNRIELKEIIIEAESKEKALEIFVVRFRETLKEIENG